MVRKAVTPAGKRLIVTIDKVEFLPKQKGKRMSKKGKHYGRVRLNEGEKWKLGKHRLRSRNLCLG